MGRHNLRLSTSAMRRTIACFAGMAFASAFSSHLFPGHGVIHIRSKGKCSISMADKTDTETKAVSAPAPKKAAAPAPKKAAAPAAKAAAKKAAAPAAKAAAKEEVWTIDNPNRKGRFPDSWRSGDDMTSEARPKGAPSSADAEKRNEAWLGTQSLVRDGMVENRKVPKAALNLPADTEIASISGFDGKSATETVVDPDLPAAGGNKGFGYNADPVFGVTSDMKKVPDFIPGLPGFNPTLRGGGWGGGAWLLKKEDRPTAKAADPELVKLNMDVRVTAWDKKLDVDDKAGWAGIFSKNQPKYTIENQNVVMKGSAVPGIKGSARERKTDPVIVERGGLRRATTTKKRVASVNKKLPKGWKAAIEADTGDEYYYNDKGETTWDLPTE